MLMSLRLRRAADGTELRVTDDCIAGVSAAQALSA
jgi:hypothetical protein